MASFDYLITCAGWEERFVEGVEKNIELHEFQNIIVLCVDEFYDKTRENFQKVERVIGKEKIQSVELFLLDDAKTWKILDRLFVEESISNQSLYIDLSTMPRFLIWFIMHFSEKHMNRAKYIYYKPERYEKCDWLTSDAETPRLVFKHSGICLPDQPTILIIQTGFDIERANQLIYTYEPEKVFLGAQVGEQFNNAIENLKKHREQLQYQEIEYFEIDAFNKDYGFSSLEKIVLENKDTRNIIMASFGPKPTALAMFKLNLKHPEIGLSYVIVKNYNDRYSHGTDLTSAVSIEFDNN